MFKQYSTIHLHLHYDFVWLITNIAPYFLLQSLRNVLRICQNNCIMFTSGRSRMTSQCNTYRTHIFCFATVIPLFKREKRLLSKRILININWRYVYNKECCKQCRYVMFKGTMTKWPVQKRTQGTTQKLWQHYDATDI